MDKIDLIIAALQRVECLFEAHGQYPHTLREVNEALAAARELRDMKPVAYWNKAGYGIGADDEDFIYPETRQHHIEANSHADYWFVPLYALDEVTK